MEKNLRTLLMLGTLGVSFAVAVVAVPQAVADPPKPAVSKMAQGKHYRVTKKELPARKDVGNGSFKRSGTVQVQVFKGRPGHDFKGDLTTTGGRTNLVLADLTDKTTVTFDVNNESMQIDVAIDGAKTTVKQNPDGSLSLDGKVYTDRKLAAKDFVKKPAMKKLTPEMWGAMDTFRFDTPVSKDAGALVDAACDLFCDTVMNGLEEAVCGVSNDGQPVWEWSCPNLGF